ncbi:MAG: hypothetical protein JXR40_02260 [Pontiellaceae bacterium]|nr:hypothetical protein [Pontiellaceae bacterium]
MSKKTWIIVAGMIAVVAALLIGIQQFENPNLKEVKPQTKETDAVKKDGKLQKSMRPDSQDIFGPSDDYAPRYSIDNLSDKVRLLLGVDDAVRNYNSMNSAVQGLYKQELGIDDVEALRDFLTWSDDVFPEGMGILEINGVKNDILERLLHQDELPEGIGIQIVEMAADSENDSTWRDYCVQFMSPYYKKQAEALSALYQAEGESEDFLKSANELSMVRDAMIAALNAREGAIAGTALIGHEMLSRTFGDFDRGDVIAKTLAVAADESIPVDSRLTALRLTSLTSSEMDDDDVMRTADTARMLVRTGASAHMRSAALVTLGETGSEEDRELLESYTLADDQQIADAAKLALL